MRSPHRNLTVQVLVAISLAILLGLGWPSAGRAMRPVGETFVNLVRMVIAPVIFLTITLGIANMRDLKKVGRVGGKALLYFELLTHVVPASAVDAFARGDVLQIVFFAVMFGAALASIGEVGRPLTSVLESLSQVIFKIVAMVMTVAPIGAFGAMAYTIGTFGVNALLPLGRLMLDVYLTMALFIFIVLNLILRLYGFSLWHYLKHIREEIVLVLGTSSSEAALPRMLEKMERYGCAKSVVGLVIPAGYSFNLDGTSIYLSMAALFVAQAFNVHLSLAQQLSVLGVLMLTSKGAAGVTGSGFIVLASTLSAMRVVPVEGVAILLGVDRFMSEARAITNLIGNGAATLVIARSEGAFDESQRARAVQQLHAERIAGTAV